MQAACATRCWRPTAPPLRKSVFRGVRAMAGAPKYDVAVKGSDGVLSDCPFCHRVLLTLEEKEVPYTTTLVDFDHKPQWLLDVNPAGSVPVMKDLASGEWVVDSGAIVDLLEQRYPQPPLGTAESSPQIGLDILPKFAGFLKAATPEEAAAKEAELLAALRALDAFLQAPGGGPYIGGAAPCATDCSVMPRLYHMQVATKHFRGWEMPAELAAVRRYMDAFMARPSWKHTVYAPELVVRGWARHGIQPTVGGGAA